MPCNAVPGTHAAVQEEAEQRQIFGVKHALIMQLGDFRATTADGVAARARCLAIHNSDGAFAMDDPNTDTGRLLRYLMRDAGCGDAGQRGASSIGCVARCRVAGGVRRVR